jgi:hypothetical protein
MENPAAVEQSSTDIELIGRYAEMEEAKDILDNAFDSRGGVLGIRGPDGVGKSRFARSVAQAASKMGFITPLIPTRGSFYHPYLPLTRLVSTLLRLDHSTPPEELFQQLESALAGQNLSNLLTFFCRIMGLPSDQAGGMRTRPSEGSDFIEGDPDSFMGQAEVADGLSKLLLRLLEQQKKLCLIFDDLDEAGDLLPLVIQGVTQRLDDFSEFSLLIVATFDSQSPREITDLFKRSVELDLLKRRDALALGAAWLRAKSLSSGLTDRLWGDTKGNPAFIALLLDALKQDGHITLREDGEAILTLLADDSTPDLAGLVRKQVHTLPESQRLTLICCAILGDGLRTGALFSLRGSAATDLARADLAELVKAGWLGQYGEDRRAIYTFSYRAVRKAIYDNIETTTRERLHQSAGDYYAPPRPNWWLRTENTAYHYAQARMPEAAIPIIEMALAQARESGEKELLITLYRLGIKVTEHSTQLRMKQIDMAEGLGDLFAAHGEYEQAVEVYTQRTPSVASTSLIAKLSLVLLAVDPARAVTSLTRSVSLLNKPEHSELYWRVEAALAWALALNGQSYDAIRRCRDGLSRTGETMGLGLPRTLLRGVLGMILFYDGDEVEAHPHLESARASWGARGEEEGVMLINQILIKMPKTEITRAWLRVLLKPVLRY